MSFQDELLSAYKNGVYLASDERFKRDYYQCGIPGVDRALKGGLIKGGMMEIYGPWSVGKTLLMLQFLIKNQKRGGTSVLFLSEGKAAFDQSWFGHLGGDLDNLLVIPVSTLEDVFTKIYEMCVKAQKSNYTDGLIFGWDSIAATGSNKLFETGMDKVDFTKAKAISEGCKLITTILGEVNASLVATNQERSNIRDPEWAATNTAGGKGFKYHCSQRIEMTFDGGPGSSQIKIDDVGTIGHRIKGRIIKNRGKGPVGKFKLSVYQDDGYPHPVFEGLEVRAGIDIPESVWTYYASEEAVFGENNVHLLTNKGQRWALHDAVVAWTKDENKSFYRKQWPDILKQNTQLLDCNYDPFNLCEKCQKFTPKTGNTVCEECS